MKKTWSIFLVLAMILGLTACGSKPTTTVSSTASSSAISSSVEQNPKADLKFWYWADNTTQSDLIKSIVKSFNDSNKKNITVTAEEYPWDSGKFTNTVFTAVMGGGGPDISTFKLQAGKMFAANKVLADMSSYIDKWADKSQISDSIWTAMKNSTGDSKLSSLPWTVEALYVYYRPSYFTKAGITKVPATFDEFLEDIKKCTMDTNGDGKTDVYGLGLRGAGGGQEWLGNFLYPYGATWADLTTPAAVKAYKAYLSIYTNKYAPASSTNAAYAEIVDGFKTGLTAMIIHHIGSYSTWTTAFKDDVDAFPMPGSASGQWTAMGDTEFTVYEQSKNKDAAFEFYKYMTTGEGGTAWFKGTGKGLSTSNIKATDEFKNNKFQAVAAASLKFAGVLPPTDTLSEFVNNVWTSTNQQALLGKITPEAALALMQKALHGK